MRIFMVICLMLCGFCGLAHTWEDVSDNLVLVQDILGVEAVNGTNELYLYLENKIYRSINNGEDWEEIDLPYSKVKITGIAANKESIFIATNAGLYTKEGDKTWDRIPGSPGLEGLRVFGNSSIIAWGDNEIYVLKNGQLKKIKSFSGTVGGVQNVIFQDPVIWAATPDELYYSLDGLKTWGKYDLYKTIDEEVGPVVIDEELVRVPFIKSLESDKDVGVVVSTPSYVLVISGSERGEIKYDTTGLTVGEVVYAIYTKLGIIAATRNKVFVYDGSWRPIFEPSKKGIIRSLKISVDEKGHEYLWIVTDRSVYRENFDLIPDIHWGNSGMTISNSKNDNEELRLNNNPELGTRNPGPQNEPSIREVQQMAIAYAEVDPQKINNWRKGAKWRAVMPKVSLSYSRGIDENVEIYKSASTSYVVRGPNEEDCDWGVGLTWDMSDLVWNDAQTSIDVRSKLMVQLRDEILEEVTRLYFERKRLLMEMGESIDNRLRIEELTAYIDAFTGGCFSRSIKRPK